MIKDSEATEQESNPPSHLDSLEESLRKCNLSFSFNFDFQDVKSDSSSDSESANLRIDVSEVDNYEASNRKKRESVEEVCVSSVLNEMEEEIERQLDAKAAKTNLTATNVKNILRHVITNEHVMAMVQKQLHDKEDDVMFEPKLTRAKAKELAAAQVDIPWPITPIKKPTSEVQVLIEEELSEDSSDEEYKPEHDKQSDDERETENYANHDAKSHPVVSTAGTDTTRSEKQQSAEVQYDAEGIFKIPETPHVPEEVDSIGQRTRSKLCLSETSLEQIEQAFVPPDITTDMYDWDGEIDEDWDNFLKEFTRPLTQEPTADDDPEADPEYNILDDEEIELLDKEELRADKAVKVTRKELNNLIAELFEFTDTFSQQQQETSKKKKVVENLQLPPGHSTLSGTIPKFPTSAEPEIPKVINFEQQELLATQLRQHVQLTAQHFVMTYMRPQLHAQSCTCKKNLLSLQYLSPGPHSAFNVANLPHAIKLITEWENKLSDEKFRENYIAELADKRNKVKINTGTSNVFYAPRFHSEIEKLFVESTALMYPQLLPHVLFSAEAKICIRQAYTKPEELLIAIGLEQFLPLVASAPKKFKGKKFHMMDTLQLISQYLLPWRDPRALRFHIQRRRWMKDGNPIQQYFQKGTAPKIRHYMMATYDLKAPKDQPSQLLPLHWQKYLKNTKYGTKNVNCLIALNSYKNLERDCLVPKNHPLRNPVVNIMSKKITKRNTPRQTDVNVNSVRNITPTAESPHASSARVLSLPTLPDTFNMSLPNQTSGETRCAEISASSNSSTLDSSHKDTSETVEKPESPQVRRTTPRLAKTKSAQNMKLMAQVLGPKGISSNCGNLKSRDKSDIDKSKSSVLPKVDDEDEIAELMLASTTIKRDAVSRKKAKEARELENIKRLLESENPVSEEERETKFAASYFQKLHLTLEPHDTEILKTVIKLYIDYNEKLEEISKLEGNFLTEKLDKDALVIELYQNVCDKLRVYPELCSEFLLFLSPHQAAMIDKSVEYTMLQKMNKFVNVAQIYFTKQPSRIAKMMHAITQLSSDTGVTLESVYGVIAPLLKGHPLIMDLFLQVLPTAKPPESLFASHLFENLVCPIGPHEKNKIYTEDAPELYENIDLPVLPIQDDPYGGDNCKCQCHNIPDGNTKTAIEHCISCGIRYLNGRIYLQTTEGLRPAKVIFPGAEEEKLENMARVSLKTADKFVSPAVPKRRRRSSKNELTNDEPWQKSMPPKNSPVKETEQLEKVSAKSKKAVKNVPLKTTECKKPLKRFPNFDDEAICSKRIRKREKRIDSPDGKHECGNPSGTESAVKFEPNQNLECEPTNVDSNYSESELEEVLNPIAEVSMEGVQKLIESGTDPTCSIQTDKTTDENITTNSKPWSRKEDMILLQTIKEEYSENSLVRVSEALQDRTLDQVKERCQVLLTLLEKMV